MFIAVCVYGAGRDNIDRSTLPAFSLTRFMGRWYEIARFDHSFERGMSHVTADYTLAEDGSVEVVNSGMRQGRPPRPAGAPRPRGARGGCGCRSSGSSISTTT